MDAATRKAVENSPAIDKAVGKLVRLLAQTIGTREHGKTGIVVHYTPQGITLIEEIQHRSEKII